MTKINIAVVGCGKIGTKHLDSYRSIKNVKVIAVCDTNEEIAKNIAGKYDVTPYNNLEKMFKNENLDAIDVCVPTPFHHKIILKALDNALHVFCEKPLTHKLEYAREIEKRQRETGNVVMVGYLYRFHPSFKRLKEILENEIIGKPYFAMFRLGGRGGHRSWKHREGVGGGALFEMMVHMIDLALMCLGEFDEVENLFSGTILKRRTIDGKEIEVSAEDMVLARLKSIDGVQVFCEADLITPSYMNSVEVHGDNGSFFGTILHYFPTFVYCKEPQGAYKRGLNIFENPYVNLFEKELEYFVNVLSGNANPVNTVEESIKTLEIIEEIRRQSKRRNLQ